MARRTRTQSGPLPDVDPVVGFRVLRTVVPPLNGFDDLARAEAWRLDGDASLTPDERFRRLFAFFCDRGHRGTAERIVRHASDPDHLARNAARRRRLTNPDQEQ